jgi:hypothetical protein
VEEDEAGDGQAGEARGAHEEEDEMVTRWP